MKNQGDNSRTYIAIDLKSFYASVECRDMGLDPLSTNLVVADAERTEKTICLAVSPSLKAFGIPGRPRLFEVVERVREVNAERKTLHRIRSFSGGSSDIRELEADPSLAVDYITAKPRMARYMQVSTEIYRIYLRSVSPEDIYVYSIDEVFLDATHYLETNGLSARAFAKKLIRNVQDETGITATAGIGTNLYLAKIAMDIVAKHIPADADGVRIAELDEKSYRQKLWNHRPLTDFWRVGKGYARKLEARGLYTMGDIARCSVGRKGELLNADALYRMFGVNAELLIDHAWGFEPVTIADIKAYRPDASTVGVGQVLAEPYDAGKARVVVLEMADSLALSMVEKELAANQVILTVEYDKSSLEDPQVRKSYTGEITRDRYGRETPKHAHGSASLGGYTSSSKRILQVTEELYNRIINAALPVRRIYLTFGNAKPEAEAAKETAEQYEQMDLFTDYAAAEELRAREEQDLEKEKRRQKAVLEIRKKFGKNAILKGLSYEEGATGRERNEQVGGHRA